jgi:hypothetical protein
VIIDGMGYSLPRQVWPQIAGLVHRAGTTTSG